MKELEQRIDVVEDKRELQLLEIKATYQLLAESVKPKNLIRQLMDEKVGEKDVLKILQHGVSIVSGWLVHKFTVGKKSGFFTRILGRVGQFSITTMLNKLIRKALPF